MRRSVLLALVVLGACGGLRAGGDAGGALSTRGAVEQFLAAARAKDRVAFARVWGSANGSAATTMDRVEREKRQEVILCALAHDESRIGAPTPGEGGRTVFSVELKNGSLAATGNITAIPGPSGRYYVENVELEKFTSLCRLSAPVR
ncbi:MAG: hypothetical protein K2X99_03750 [Gemmatimonadaceae bacterium]|nr:hypothetical protein [Gemmatimonadaceae bacterium]